MMRPLALPAFVLVLSLHSSGALAEVVIDWVTVGNPGNAPDTRYEMPGYGAVPHVYWIGTLEVTAAQYTAFLNAVAATDTYDLYHPEMWADSYGCKIERLGSLGSYTYHVAGDWAERPVNYVSWGDAVRFVNWLENGQPSGPQDGTTTEDGSYYVNGAMDVLELQTVMRRPQARFALPTVDEWYKAAYHQNDGVTGNYFDYPTGSNNVPSNDLVDPDPGNNANFYQGGYTLGAPCWRTPVGAFENSASPYGTFDQGGNVWEWTETPHDWSDRFARGGGHASYDSHLRTTSQIYIWPVVEDGELGFRVARVFEKGDLDCDGRVNAGDIPHFVQAIVDPTGYAADHDGDPHPVCDRTLADVNSDGLVNAGDIPTFVDLLTGA